MKKLISRRPSPAMVVALLALFLAMGGTGYAAIKITGKNVKNSSLTGTDIKNSSLTGKDVKKSGLTGSDVKANSLTGSDIAESKLGKVGSAGKADTATSAGSAGTADSAGSVGGLTLRRVNFKAAAGTANTTVFSGAGLTITASCLGGQIALFATGSVEDSGIYTKVIDTDSNTTDFAADSESGGFDSGDTFSLLASGDANPSFLVFNYSGRDGRTVTGNLAADEGTPACTVGGTITAG